MFLTLDLRSTFLVFTLYSSAETSILFTGLPQSFALLRLDNEQTLLTGLLLHAQTFFKFFFILRPAIKISSAQGNGGPYENQNSYEENNNGCIKHVGLPPNCQGKQASKG